MYDKISLLVDDLISRAMWYNEMLYSDHSLSSFDDAANSLCVARSKIIRLLRRF